MLEKIFKLKTHKTNLKTEAIAGFTTFFTMSYILVVNPAILSSTGMNPGAVFTATCITACIGTFIMAFLANWPVALAPGMGLNVFFAYSVVVNMGFTWQEALGGVFVSGIIFVTFTLLGLRQWIISGIPSSLRYAISAGIGFFLLAVAFKNIGVFIPNAYPFIDFTHLFNQNTFLMFFGFCFIVFLNFFKFRSAILLGIFFVTSLYFIFNPGHFSQAFSHGYISLPPSLAPTFLKIDFSQVLKAGFLHIILSFVLIEMLDATTCLLGIGVAGGLIKKNNPGSLNRALFSDSLSIILGSILGTSSTTAYMESAAGIKSGGKTGLTAVFIALLFAISLFFSPIILSIPQAASTSVLLFTALFMIKDAKKTNYKNLIEFIPAFLTMIAMPIRFSIIDGISAGLISYIVLKILTKKIHKIKISTFVIFLALISRYIIEL